jgi:hypothetical protein
MVAGVARQCLRRWPSFLDMKNLRVAVTASAVLGLLVFTVSCGTVTPRMSDSTVVPIYYATDRKPLMPIEVWQAELPRKGSRFQYYGAEYNPATLEMGICPVNELPLTDEPLVRQAAGAQ